MGRRVRIGARYGDQVYKIGTADITRSGMAVFAADTTSGDHVTYPPDGRLHESSPQEGRTFRKRLPPHSQVTFQPFAEIALSSTGPPSSARTFEPTERDYVINGPTEGKGRLFTALMQSSDAASATSYMEGATSNSTQRLYEGSEVCIVLGFAPDSSGLLDD